MKVTSFCVLDHVASAGWSFGSCEHWRAFCLKIERTHKLASCLNRYTFWVNSLNKCCQNKKVLQ